MGTDTFNDDDSLQSQEMAIELVDEAMCRLYQILPILLDERSRVLTVAMADLTNRGALDDLRHLLALNEVVGVPADPKKIEAAINRYYSGKQESVEDIIRPIQAEDE